MVTSHKHFVKHFLSARDHHTTDPYTLRPSCSLTAGIRLSKCTSDTSSTSGSWLCALNQESTSPVRFIRKNFLHVSVRTYRSTGTKARFECCIGVVPVQQPWTSHQLLLNYPRALETCGAVASQSIGTINARSRNLLTRINGYRNTEYRTRHTSIRTVLPPFRTTKLGRT